MPVLIKNQPPQWRLQSSKRPKGAYYQAVCGQGKGRRVVTLGYLSEAEAESALKALRTAKAPLLASTDEDGQPVVSDDGIRTWASEVAGEAIVNELVASQARASGDYSKMPLATFVSEVYLPVRFREVATNTKKNDLVKWKKINAVIGDIPVKKVNGVVVERLLTHYAADAAPTRRRMVLTLKALLTYAESIGVLDSVPKIRAVKGGTQRVRGRPVALTSEEVGRILDQAPSSTHRALWALALGQGLRPTEACRLDWADVDWANEQLLVRGTKTEKSLRRVPMTAATKAELGPYWHSQGCPTEGYAFPNREDKHAPTRNWSRTFKAAAKRAGITKTVTAYLCRHTFATSCVVSGIPIPVAKEMLGHTALSKTLVEVYSNPDLAMMQKAVAGLTKLGG